MKKVANVWEIYSARLSFILIVKQVLVEMYSWGSTSCDFIYLKHKECMKCHTFPTRGSFSNTFSEKWWNGEQKSFLDYSRIKTFQTPRGLCPMQNCSVWKRILKGLWKERSYGSLAYLLSIESNGNDKKRLQSFRIYDMQNFH